MTIVDAPSDNSTNLDGQVKTPLTREALYALGWSEPMLKIATGFGVSSTYMARVCTYVEFKRCTV